MVMGSSKNLQVGRCYQPFSLYPLPVLTIKHAYSVRRPTGPNLVKNYCLRWNCTKDFKYFITALLHRPIYLLSIQSFYKNQLKVQSMSSCLLEHLPTSVFAHYNASLILPFINPIIHSYFDSKRCLLRSRLLCLMVRGT